MEVPHYIVTSFSGSDSTGSEVQDCWLSFAITVLARLVGQTNQAPCGLFGLFIALQG